MRKSIILLMYGTALFFILRKWYAEGNSGLPKPNIIANPTYLYGILALSSDFLEGLPIVIGAMLTVSLIWQTQNTPVSKSVKGTPPTGVKGPVTSKPPTGVKGPVGG